MRSRGPLEDSISKAVMRFEKEHLGRGPLETVTMILEDTILIRIKGVLTPAERSLAATEEGMNLVRQFKVKLMEDCAATLAETMAELTGRTVASFFTDINVKTGERIMVFIMDASVCADRR